MKRFKVTIHDKEYEVGVQEVGDEPTLSREPARRPTVPRPVGAAAQPPLLLRKDNGQVTSPIPGVVASILAEVGMTVRKGDTLLILEAMKMENDITSVRDGLVTEIMVVEGQSVNAQEILLLID